MSSPSSLWPLTSGTSSGDGMNSMTASSTRLHALVLEGGAAGDDADLVPDRALAQALCGCPRSRACLVSRYLFSSSSLPSAAALDHLGAELVALRLHVRRDRPGTRSCMPWVSSSHQMDFMLDQVDDAREVLFRADRQLDHDRVAPSGACRICSTQRRKFAPARSILLTNATRGTLVLVHLPPDRLGLGLHAGHRAVHGAPPSRARAANARLRS